MDYKELNSLMLEIEKDNKNEEKEKKEKEKEIVNRKNEMNSKLFMRDIDFKSSMNNFVSNNPHYSDEKNNEETKINFNNKINNRIFDLKKDGSMPPIMDFYPALSRNNDSQKNNK